jgi:galactokinase
MISEGMLDTLFANQFRRESSCLVVSPGRTELCGNHTDHNRGKVLAAAIDLAKTAAVAPRDDMRVEIITEGLPERVDLIIDDDKPREEEKGTSSALVRGVIAALRRKGFKAAGFSAFVRSGVALGSGLSSSASFEVLIAKIISRLFNNDIIDPLTMALAGQEAENRFFGKPCGLMDQIACSYGGIVSVDLEYPEKPIIESVDFSFYDHGYTLAVIHTGGSHADLTGDYAAVPQEMEAVARFFGKMACRQLSRNQIFEELPSLRKSVGDRAVLRALHFFNENARVTEAAEALKKGDMQEYLSIIRASAKSSRDLLQNIYSPSKPEEQNISMALALAEELLGNDGACRVHGGGFAGTIQAYVPNERFPFFRERMEHYLGKGSVTPILISSTGSDKLDHQPSTVV